MIKKPTPNLLFVFADQLRYQACGFAGDPLAQTPNLDRLAAEGAKFTNALSNMPVCCAYRASLMTGLHVSSSGMVINELNFREDRRCFGHALSDNGYETAYIGKWHLRKDKDAPIPSGPARLGFDGYWAAYNMNHNYYQAQYWLGDNTEEPITVDGYEPDVQTDLAISFLQRQKDRDKPFAMFLSWGTPHSPWEDDNVPPEFREKFREEDFRLPPNWSDEPDTEQDRFMLTDGWTNSWEKASEDWGKKMKDRIPHYLKNYYAMTANLDWNMGRLLDALEESGAADHTIVVFTSDHGEMMGAHGRMQKLTFYDEAVRIPLLIRWPDRIPSGTQSDVLFGVPDVMPTLLDLMQLPVISGVEGISYARQAYGEPGPEAETALLQGMGHTFSWKDGYEWRGLRDKRYTYAVYRRNGACYLFDNVSDPYQLNNLADKEEHAALLRHYQSALAGRMNELNDTFEPCSWYQEQWTRDRNVIRGARG